MVRHRLCECMAKLEKDIMISQECVCLGQGTHHSESHDTQGRESPYVSHGHDSESNFFLDESKRQRPVGAPSRSKKKELR